MLGKVSDTVPFRAVHSSAEKQRDEGVRRSNPRSCWRATWPVTILTLAGLARHGQRAAEGVSMRT